MKRFETVTAGFSRIALVGLSLAVLGGCGALSGLDDRPNVGPCPVAGVLYDAQRVVEIGEIERHENVGYTGAIEGVKGFCRYVGKNPITMEVEVNFSFGKGPKAVGDERDYTYFVSVTRRDRSVLAKDLTTIKVKFPKGADIVRRRETITGIVIPRASETVSGTNFEVIVGFELTPEQLAYNRSGKRFTINVQK